MTTTSLKASLSSPAAVCPASESSTNSALGTVIQKVPHAFRADHVGQLAADQQHRDRQVGGGLLEFLGAQFRVVARLGHKRRIPMPVPPAVAQPQVLLQPLRAARPGPMRQIRGDRVSGFLQRAEPVHTAEHELADARAAVLLEPRHHVDQHQPRDPVGSGLICGEDAGQPAHAGPDEVDRPADRIEHLHDVSGQRLDVVVGVGCPITVTVPATVERDDVKSRVGQHLSGVFPGEPVLAAAVQHQDRRPIGRRVNPAVPFVGDQRESIDAGILDCLRSAAHGSQGRPLG